MIVRKPIQDGRDGERSGHRKLSTADPFNIIRKVCAKFDAHTENS